MKLAACMVLAVAEAKLKIKNLDIPDLSFFTYAHSDEKHMGLPDNNPAYHKYFEPTQREREYHGACFHGNPHDMEIKDGRNSENSHWRCALVNKKRKNANSPRDFVCFPQCADWTKKKQHSNPDSFTGCRLHAPITNPINGWATCQKGKWVVEKPLKKCFCDLCDPRDAQKQLRKKQKQGRHEDYGADFSNPITPWETDGLDNTDFISHSHQQIIIGSCGADCIYQPIGYQQGKEGQPALQKRDPPTAVCDRKKREWNFKDKCNCIDLCTQFSPGLPSLDKIQANGDPDLHANHWSFKLETGKHNEWIQSNDGQFNWAELDCGTDLLIKQVCGDKGLRKREKRHFFCANGEWISGADNNPTCQCEKKKAKKVKKSKDKHNKDKPKKNKKRPDVNGSDDRPNKPAHKEQTKHKKNKH